MTAAPQKEYISCSNCGELDCGYASDVPCSDWKPRKQKEPEYIITASEMRGSEDPAEQKRIRERVYSRPYDPAAIQKERERVLVEAISEIASRLNNTDRYWKGMGKSIEILEKLRQQPQEPEAHGQQGEKS